MRQGRISAWSLRSALRQRQSKARRNRRRVVPVAHDATHGSDQGVPRPRGSASESRRLPGSQWPASAGHVRTRSASRPDRVGVEPAPVQRGRRRSSAAAFQRPALSALDLLEWGRPTRRSAGPVGGSGPRGYRPLRADPFDCPTFRARHSHGRNAESSEQGAAQLPPDRACAQPSNLRARSRAVRVPGPA
jgi:hypothetical protein